MVRSTLLWMTLATLVFAGCGKTEPPTAELTPAAQEEIKKHDAAVQAAESAHNAQPPKK